MNKRTVLITGANKSIGYETARIMGKAGYHILLGSRDKGNGETAIAKLKAEGLTDVDLVLIDVSNEASVLQAHEAVKQLTDKLDVLVNNAGIRGRMPQAPTTIDNENIHEIFETNFFGPIRVTRAFIDMLKLSDQPRIVNVTSGLASLTGHSDPKWPYYSFKSAGYGPSKTALNAYTVSLAYELRDTPFKVNAVDPGYTDTDFNDHTGTKHVEDAAKTIAQYAMLNANGPTGKFLDDNGEISW